MLGGAILAITRQALVAVLPAQVSNGWATLFQQLSPGGQISVFSILALAMSILVQFGGFTVFVGGLLCLKDHVRSGKELVGLGTTVGFADLLLLIPALATNQEGPPLWLAWIGLLLSVFADRHIRGPKASYAGEVRNLIVALRSRVHARARKKRLRQRRRRIRTGEASYSARH